MTMIELDDSLEHSFKYIKDSDNPFTFDLVSDSDARDYLFDYLIEVRFALIQDSILFNHITTGITQP